MSEMKTYSDVAWNIASKYSHVLASETRDLAAWIDHALASRTEECARRVEAIGNYLTLETAHGAIMRPVTYHDYAAAIRALPTEGHSHG